MNLLEVYKKFKTESDCHNYLIQLRWGKSIQCVYCESFEVYRRSYGNGLKCKNCNSSFTVTTGTILHSTNVPLMKWFLAIVQILAAKKGISSLQLARTIDVNKNTAWLMQKRLRAAMKTDVLLSGIVEIDETYIGGNLGNKHKSKKKKVTPNKTGMTHKSPVLGMIEKTSGTVVLNVLKHANGANIKPIIFDKVEKNSTVVTDGFGGYSGLDKHYKKHVKMNHEKKIRSVDGFNTSKIEGFFTIIKRAIIGQYHKLSEEHLQSYMDEIAFKQNYAKQNAFEVLLQGLCAEF